VKVNKNMKFILTISICSVAFQDCSPPVQHDVLFDNFDNCVKTALNEMTNIQNMLNTDMVNKNLLGPQFKCKPVTSL
jgi:hypothetical protein